jgi:hypothetical protein
MPRSERLEGEKGETYGSFVSDIGDTSLSSPSYSKVVSLVKDELITTCGIG